MAQTEDKTVDVIVVGAGLTGLVAAHRLEEAGLTTLVVEATGGIGGHLRSRTIDGQVVELGAEALSPRHERVQGMARDLGLTVEPSALAGSPQLLWRIGSKPRVGRIPPMSASETFHFMRAALRLRGLARQVPPEAAWTASRAAEFDAISFGEWLQRQRVTGAGYRMAVALVGGYATFALERLSLLYVLRWVSRSGGVLQGYRYIGTLQIREGTQELARRTQQRLRGEVVLGAPVHRIAQDSAGVQVDAGARGSWRGRRAIVSVPISMMGEIEFDPPLPEEQAALHRELRFGKAAKAVVVAPDRVPVKHRGTLGGAPVEVSWLRGRSATALATGELASTRPEALSGQLAGLYGLDLARCEAESVEWTAEPFMGGSYLVWEPGQLLRHGPNLQLPHRLVHFAGADRSSWTGMEGAIQNGEQVAEAIRSAEIA
jgi:monoamine oxidase